MKLFLALVLSLLTAGISQAQCSVVIHAGQPPCPPPPSGGGYYPPVDHSLKDQMDAIEQSRQEAIQRDAVRREEKRDCETNARFAYQQCRDSGQAYCPVTPCF